MTHHHLAVLCVGTLLVFGAVGQTSAQESAPLPDRYAEAVLQVEGMI